MKGILAHPKIDPREFYENGKVLSDIEINNLYKLVNEKIPNENQDLCRYTKSYLASIGIFLKTKSGTPRGGLIVSKDAAGQNDLYMVCKGTSLGEGTFGKFKIIQNLKTGKLYAIKVLKNVTTEAEMEAAIEEAQHMENLERGSAQVFYKKTIVKTADGSSQVMYSQKSYFMAELIPGQSLDKILETQSLSAEDRLNLMIQACNQIRFLHKRYRHLHRDIKPANFMYDPITKKLKIIDFGTLLPISPGIGEVTGSRAYMPPYVMKGQFTAKSDIYALGRTFQEVLGIKENAFLPHYNRHFKYGYTDELAEWQFADSDYDALKKLVSNMVQMDSKNVSVSLPKIINELKRIQAEHCNRNGEEAFKQKNYNIAIKNFETAKSSCPSNPVYLLNLAHAYLKVEDYSQAEAGYRQAHSLNPHLKTAAVALKSLEIFNRGKSNFTAGKYLQALADFEEAGNLNSHLKTILEPLEKEARNKQALIYYTDGNKSAKILDYQRATASYNQAARLDPSMEYLIRKTLKALHHLKQANLSYENNDYQAAIRFYNEARTLNPQLAEAVNPLLEKTEKQINLEALLKQGNYAFLKKNYKSALLYYQQAMEINPSINLPNMSIAKKQIDLSKQKEQLNEEVYSLELQVEKISAKGFQLKNLLEVKPNTEEMEAYRSRVEDCAILLKSILKLELKIESLNDKDMAFTEEKSTLIGQLNKLKSQLLASFLPETKHNSLNTIMNVILTDPLLREEYEDYLSKELLSWNARKFLEHGNIQRKKGKDTEAISLYNNALILLADGADPGLQNIINEAKEKVLSHSEKSKNNFILEIKDNEPIHLKHNLFHEKSKINRPKRRQHKPATETPSPPLTTSVSPKKGG